MSPKRQRTRRSKRSRQLPAGSWTRRILGIDPGLASVGWGLVESRGNQIRLLRYGCITTKKEESTSDRLRTIHEEMKKILQTAAPDVVGIEQLFFAKNAKTAMAVGEARGVILLVCAEANQMVAEYTPLAVKQALTGFGRAEKQQVQRVVKLRLNLDDIPRPDDAADAIAVAMCAAQNQGSPY